MMTVTGEAGFGKAALQRGALEDFRLWNYTARYRDGGLRTIATETHGLSHEERLFVNRGVVPRS